MFAEIPLLTGSKERLSRLSSSAILTRDVGAVLELFGHHRVHLDHKVSFFCHVLVSVLDLFADPLLERLVDDRRAHVDDPLLGRLRNVLVVWEE